MNNDQLHKETLIHKGDFFVEYGRNNYRIGQVIKGVLRGYTINNDGDEVTTHFYMEGDIVSGNYVPNIPSTINILAMEDCIISVADYREVFTYINTNSELSKVILHNFQKLNRQNHSRIEVLLKSDSLDKYRWFLKEYPNLLNRVAHYLIAGFLGMTPTQLSRTRKSFSQQM